MKEMDETHDRGHVSIHNLDQFSSAEDLTDADFGLQIAKDGRVWVCVNGVALVRFKPHQGDWRD